MTSNETRRYMMLVRVRDFGEAHRDTFAHSGTAQQQIAALNAAIAQLGAQAVKKVSAARHGRARRMTARNALIAQLMAIARTARAVAEDAPGARDDFRMYRLRTDQALITLGRSFADKAAGLLPLFVDHGMPETCIAELNTAIGEFEQAVQQSEIEKRQYANARAAMRAAFKSGTAAVRRLDAVVANQMRTDPVTLVMWQLARHIGLSPRRRGMQASAADGPSADVQRAVVQRTGVQ